VSEGVVRKRKKTSFVPKVVFATACVGVVPVCATEGCTAGSGPLAGSDAGNQPDRVFMGVAAVAYQCFDSSLCGAVGVAAFDATFRDVYLDSEGSDGTIGDAFGDTREGG
jgi:hypothetical protein